MGLRCRATKSGVVSSSKREYKFKDLWNEVVKRGVNLSLKDQVFSLHDLRNLVQHQGDIPPMEAIIKYKGYVEDFFTKQEYLPDIGEHLKNLKGLSAKIFLKSIKQRFL